ncbi:hypothetical protein ABZS66_14300 [Dactylosporangium sp. NPDC005572]|uniref:hypothetical protein n=1 Tax=Dactylosporangium sp. NPDC005572 TaxID=3156889 RepID=UPI0033BB0930
MGRGGRDGRRSTGTGIGSGVGFGRSSYGRVVGLDRALRGWRVSVGRAFRVGFGRSAAG